MAIARTTTIALATTFTLLGAGALALAGLRAGLHHAIRAGLAAPRVRETESPAAHGLLFETVHIRTANGKRLHAWLVPADAAAPAPAVVLLHGWGGNAQAMLPLARPLHAAGFTTLFLDARCHGLSDADSYASLPRFAEDASRACDWLAARPDVDPRRIALVGHSVGAGACLLAAAERRDVAAVVSIAAFAHPAEMMRRWLAAKSVPELAAGYVVNHVERVIGRRYDDIAPLCSIARIGCPVLLVHGEHDRVVPPDDARRLFAACRDGAAELVMLPADHESFVDVEHGTAALVAFLERCCEGRIHERPAA